MTNAIIAYQVDLKMSNTEGGTYARLVTELVSGEIPSEDVSDIEATHQQSPNRTREYVPGWKTPSTVSFEANFTETDYVALKAVEGLPKWFQESFPGGTKLYTFPGYVKNAKPTFDARADAPVGMTFDIRVTGAVTVVDDE